MSGAPPTGFWPLASSTRPAAEEAFDFIRQAQEEGPSINQAFHDSMAQRGGKLYAVIADICALANTHGGTLYIGLDADPAKAPAGVPNPESAVRALEKETRSRISPPVECQVDTQKTRGKTVLRVLVPHGDDPPYAVDDNKVYGRDEAEPDGGRYYTMRDLPNGNVVKNVTQASARRLWHYAITEFDRLPAELGQAAVSWQRDGGVFKSQQSGG